MRRVAKAFGVTALAVVMFVVGGIGLLRRVHREPSPAPHAAGPALSSKPLIEAGSLSEIIANLQERLRSVPVDWRSYADLGLAYVEQARLTADPSYYPKAEAVLRRSLKLNGAGNFSALTGMAALAAARHDFSGALTWGLKATTVNPDSAEAYAVVADARVELGRYDTAFHTFQTMIDLRPELSTYARVSYGWELQGDSSNATKAMELALHAAATPTDAAWASNQLGDLYWNRGCMAEAEGWYRRAVTAAPSFVPPHAGLARVEAARGQTDRAIRDLTWVVDRYPSPEYVIALGDLYRVSGRPAEAARRYALVHAEERLLRAGGVNVDLEIALFDADHGVELANGLAAARKEWTRRRSIQVADALAWELYANGRDREALRYANRALRLGTRNALFVFHRGMIERALGRLRAARRDLSVALEINPHFSILWSERAAQVLASLGGAP
ncbi:MAG TPA: tetratricopeptide repeat protein [Actinomycetota bacterium]|nr:tetratricopeptide repeat protein [Actinomycetota bacterium]